MSFAESVFKLSFFGGYQAVAHMQPFAWRLSPFVPQAVRLESGWSERVRYMVVIYTSGHQDTEENIVVGMDFTDKDRWFNLPAASHLLHFNLMIGFVKMFLFNICDLQ